MANIIDVFGRYFRPYKRIFLIVFLSAIFLFIAYYCYNTFFIPKQKSSVFSDVANANVAKKPLEVYFFFANWCPHCKSALPEWKVFREEYQDQIIGQFKVNCITVDCTDDSSPETIQRVSDFKVDSYPTVKIVKEDITIDFDAKVNKYNLEQMIYSVTKA
jgi:thiol-disulfide isomerase/thioredoxin